MGTSNVTDLSLFLNKQIESREQLREFLSKATALMRVSLEDNFLDHPKVIVNLYQEVMSDLIEHSRTLNEEALSELRLEKFDRQND